MPTHLRLTKTEGKADDTIHIGANRNRIKGHINVIRFQDVDTRQIVAYVPAFDISAYGETEEKAADMLNMEIHAFFDSLLDLSTNKLAETLRSLGFIQDKNRHKDFSKVVVDGDGNLQNFNIEKGTLQRFALVA